MTEIPLFVRLRDLAGRYDAFIVDLWGTLHDGVAAFPEAADCLIELRRAGKGIALLSNAPRRIAEILARNREMGIGPEHFDTAYSSGEATWQHLNQRADPWYRALGKRCYHLGPARDLGMREGLDYEFVDSVEAADFILNTGADRSDDTVETYADLLDAALARGLPMVCANPDLVVLRGGEWEICAGALALHYEQRGGRVRSHGKPARDVFDTCLALLGDPDRRRVANIGDSLRTDIAGAAAAGIDGLFITSGIHGAALAVDAAGVPAPGKLAALCAEAGQRPAAALPHLRW